MIVAGSISLGLGTLGIIVPVLPTTPFLLLAVACFMRSSERLLNWLLNNRWFGKYIRNYQEGKGIPKKTKIVALSFLWITIIYSTCFIVEEILIAQVALLLVAVGVTIHLIRTPTFKANPKLSS